MVTLAIDDPATFRRINTDQPVIMFRGTGDKAQESGQGRLVKKAGQAEDRQRKVTTSLRNGSKWPSGWEAAGSGMGQTFNDGMFPTSFPLSGRGRGQIHGYCW